MRHGLGLHFVLMRPPEPCQAGGIVHQRRLRVPLSADGLSVTGPDEKIYDGWQYPEEWDVETFAQ